MNPSSYFQRGVDEIHEGATHWRLWHTLGSGELKRRYSRSRIGQFWLSLSTGLSTLILGVVWSVLWRVEPASFLPHLTVSLLEWQLMSGILTEAGTLFPANRHLLLAQRIPCSTLVISMIYKHLLTFLHNCVIIALVFLLFSHAISWSLLLLPLAIALFIVCAIWISYLTALICARFRDVNYAMQTVLQLFFYITPVIWKPEFLSEAYRWLLAFNPFAVFITIFRASIAGEPFPTQDWMLAAAIAMGGLFVALPIIGRHRRQLMFWI